MRYFRCPQLRGRVFKRYVECCKQSNDRSRVSQAKFELDSTKGALLRVYGIYETISRASINQVWLHINLASPCIFQTKRVPRSLFISLALLSPLFVLTSSLSLSLSFSSLDVGAGNIYAWATTCRRSYLPSTLLLDCSPDFPSLFPLTPS